MPKGLDTILSTKGNEMLYLEGHLFYKDRVLEHSTYWRCKNSRKLCRCPARVITACGKVTKTCVEHNHTADAAEVEAIRCAGQIAHLARTTDDCPKLVATAVVSKASECVAARLPSVANIKRNITRIRQSNEYTPDLPEHRRDIIFSTEYTVTSSGENFLLYDSEGEDRIIIFSTENNLQLLADSEHWLADGTFKNVPTLFEQLYTIRGLEEGLSVPLVYVLLPGKTKELYQEMLTQLVALEPRLAPKSITIDYEAGMLSACNAVFPDAEIKGCFFHLSQCILSRLQAEGLKMKYETDAGFSLQIRLLAALAFVPQTLVEYVFSRMCDEESFSEEARSVLLYFEENFIGRPTITQRAPSPPKFPTYMWNVLDQFAEGRAGITNSVNEWHFALQKLLGSTNPSIWRFLNALKRNQASLTIEQKPSGASSAKKRRKDCNVRIQKVIANIDPIEQPINYVRQIAHGISF